MICFARSFRGWRRPAIRFNMDASMILFVGARRESIDALFDGEDRVRQLIVHTRQKDAGAFAFRRR